MMRKAARGATESFDALTETLNKLRKTQDEEINSGRADLGAGE